ncbi:unknown [Dialister invisus CAG:218]|nr:unknown [Dialister invisus CAG:218]
MGELVLGQMVHHVRLVFGKIRSFFHLILSAGTVISDPCIMTCSEVGTVKKGADGVVKKTELNFKIAHHTGIRRDAVFVRIHKIGQHYVLIHFPHINDLVGDTEEVSHFLRLC